MDVAGLRDRIQATLDANAAVRQQAELDLKHAEEKPGFTGGLLDILEQEQHNAVRLSSNCRLPQEPHIQGLVTCRGVQPGHTHTRG